MHPTAVVCFFITMNHNVHFSGHIGRKIDPIFQIQWIISPPMYAQGFLFCSPRDTCCIISLIKYCLKLVITTELFMCVQFLGSWTHMDMMYIHRKQWQKQLSIMSQLPAMSLEPTLDRSSPPTLFSAQLYQSTLVGRDGFNSRFS